MPACAGMTLERSEPSESYYWTFQCCGVAAMTLWITLAVNSIALGGLLFLLSAGFSLIFGLMRIPNLMHGSFFMLGAYLGVTFLNQGLNFWLAALLSGLAMAVIGG